MTWTIIILLAVGVASLRLLGMYGGTALVRRVPMFERLGSLIPAAVVSAVIAQLTFASGKSLTIDARSAGVAVAAVLIWRRAPIIVVILAAAATTALLLL